MKFTYIILYYIKLYYIILNHIILYYIILYYTILYILQYIVYCILQLNVYIYMVGGFNHLEKY